MSAIKTAITPEFEALKQQLRDHRVAQYIRLRGGIPIPLAGVVYWLLLAFIGTQGNLENWVAIALPLSGAIFPLALLFAALMRNNFMKDKSVVGDVLLPTFIGMLLFWPMLIIAIKSAAPATVVPILAIGMSIHWPVIGWSYGRTSLFSGHAILRATLVLLLWFTAADQILIYIPLAVASVYILTIFAIYLDVNHLKSKSNPVIQGPV